MSSEPQQSVGPELRKVRVWDLPTRTFHWSLLALVLASWFSGGEEGLATHVHRYSGEALAGLLIFRVIWGFVGNEHARFRSFAAGPNAILAHIRDLMSSASTRHLGHNPLGGLAVFLLLLSIASVVVTGLFSASDDLTGPFARWTGADLSDAHELAFRLLQGLVLLHLAGVAFESWRYRDALLPAMLNGIKTRRSGEVGESARPARIEAFAFSLIISIIVAGWLMQL